jgi:hypothetical protein
MSFIKRSKFTRQALNKTVSDFLKDRPRLKKSMRVEDYDDDGIEPNLAIHFYSLYSKEQLQVQLSVLSEALTGITSEMLNKDGIDVVLYIRAVPWLPTVHEVVTLTKDFIEVDLRACKLLVEENKEFYSDVFYKPLAALPDVLKIGR